MAIILANPVPQFLDANGDPYASGTLTFSKTGTATAKNIYPTEADAEATTNELPNPITLNSQGFPEDASNNVTAIWLLTDEQYRCILKDSSGTVVWTEDDLGAVAITSYSDGESIDDNNTNELITFGVTSSAVNELKITNAATSGAPLISVIGNDTNIDFSQQTKGSGVFNFLDGNGNELLTSQAGVTSAVNNLSIKNAATGSNPELQAEGGDSNIGVIVQPKGTGAFEIKGTSSAQAEIRLYEDTDNGSNYLALQPPAAVTTTTTWTLPDGDGSADQILQTDGSGNLSFATNAAAGEWILVSSATASTSSTIDFTGLSSTYSTYCVTISDLKISNDDIPLLLRTSTDNGSSFDSGAGNYDYAGEYVTTGGAELGILSTSDTEIELIESSATNSLGNATDESLSGIVWIFDPSSTVRTRVIAQFCYENSAGAGVYSDIGGTRLDTTAVNAIRFTMSAGTMSSGEFRLYGLVDA